jgi:hypothetical protein
MKKFIMALFYTGMIVLSIHADTDANQVSDEAIKKAVAAMREKLPACSDIEHATFDTKWNTNVRYIPSATSDTGDDFIDSKSIKIDKKNKTITFWGIGAQNKYGQKLLAEEYGDRYSDYSHMTYLKVFNYSKKQVLSKDYVNYRCYGRTYDESKGGLNKWMEIVPGSVDNVNLDVLMKKYKLK